jgi:hypothetical protein
VYQRFQILTGLSIAYGAAGWKIADFLEEQEAQVWFAAAAAVALSAGSSATPANRIRSGFWTRISDRIRRDQPALV